MASWYEISNGLSGLLFILLGLLVGRVRRGGASNHAFALFAVAFGAGVVVLNLVLPGHPIVADTPGERAVMALDAALWLAAAAGLVWLAAALPRHTRWERMAQLASFAVAAGYLGLAMAMPAPQADPLFFVGFQALLGVMWGLCVLFAFRFAGAPPGDAMGYATMGAALALYPAFWGALQFSQRAWLAPAQGADAMGLVFHFGPALLAAAAWTIVLLRSSGARARMARTVVWWCLAAALLGQLAVRSSNGSEHWGYGAARFAAVGLLAFAIVRGQAPGIDGHLRFGVSRSTIAAAFVAVFFLVSEGAQIVLGQQNQTLGLLAAGALVFAFSPLQRAAERFAERAVPVRPTAGQEAERDKEDVYRQALRLAIREGQVDPETQLRCAELAESLGIGAGRAVAMLQDEVEAAAADGS